MNGDVLMSSKQGKHVMSWRSLLVFCLYLYVWCPRSNGVSISVLVNHRQTFAVREIREPAHIQLPSDIEEELKFEPRRAGNKLNVTQEDENLTQLSIKDEELRNNDTRTSTNADYESRNEEPVIDDENGDKDFDDNIDDGNSDDDDINEEEDEDDGMINNYDNFGSDDELIQTQRYDGTIDDYNINDDGVDDDDDYVDDVHNGIKELPLLHTYPQTSSREQLSKDLSDVTDEDAEIENLYKLTNRNKRAANEQWRNALHGIDESKKEKDPLTSDIWEDVTDEELNAIQQQQYIRLAKYIGWTLLSVGFFVLVGICFLRDPIACIFSFGTGCPCFFIICPCVRGFIKKHLNVKQMVKDAMNKYTPGVIVHDDGSLQHYEPTAEEVEYLKELLDELAGETVV